MMRLPLDAFVDWLAAEHVMRKTELMRRSHLQHVLDFRNVDMTAAQLPGISASKQAQYRISRNAEIADVEQPYQVTLTLRKDLVHTVQQRSARLRDLLLEAPQTPSLSNTQDCNPRDSYVQTFHTHEAAVAWRDAVVFPLWGRCVHFAL